jgi:hypothetical protein
LAHIGEQRPQLKQDRSQALPRRNHKIVYAARDGVKYVAILKGWFSAVRKDDCGTNLWRILRGDFNYLHAI